MTSNSFCFIIWSRGSYFLHSLVMPPIERENPTCWWPFLFVFQKEATRSGFTLQIIMLGILLSICLLIILFSVVLLGVIWKLDSFFAWGWIRIAVLRRNSCHRLSINFVIAVSDWLETAIFVFSPRIIINILDLSLKFGLLGVGVHIFYSYSHWFLVLGG